MRNRPTPPAARERSMRAHRSSRLPRINLPKQRRRPPYVPRVSVDLPSRASRSFAPATRRELDMGDRFDSSGKTPPYLQDRLQLLHGYTSAARTLNVDRFERELPLSIRLAHGLIAVLAVALLLQAWSSDQHVRYLQTFNQGVCSLLLLIMSITGVLDLHRSSLICTGGAIIGWWLALSSVLFGHAAVPAVPIIGLIIFVIAGWTGDTVADFERPNAAGGIP